MACSGESWTTPPMSKRTPATRATGLSGRRRGRPGPRTARRAPLAGLAVDDGELARLGHALGRALDQRLVDPLLHDLVADVVGAVHVEALLVEAEADRHRRVLHQHEVRGLQRHRQLRTQPIGARGDAAHDHELPEAQALEIDRVEAPVLDERAADVDLVVDAVGLLLLEVVREDVLRRLLLEIEIRGDRVADARDALFEHAALAVDGTEPRVEARAVRRDLLAYGVAERPEMLEERLHLRAQERDDAHLVAGGDALAK